MAKKMKKLFSLILALSMVMSLMSVAASAAGSDAQAKHKITLSYAGEKDLPTPAAGKMAAVKHAELVDAENGIVKITMDVAGTPITTKNGVDVVLVADESNSMNMFADMSTSNIGIVSLCLNKDHWYGLDKEWVAKLYTIPEDAPEEEKAAINAVLEAVAAWESPLYFQPTDAMRFSISREWGTTYADDTQRVLTAALKALDDGVDYTTSIDWNNLTQVFGSGGSCWPSGENHYVYDVETGVYNKMVYDDNSGSLPFGGNEYGCYDRLTTEKNAFSTFINGLLDENKNAENDEQKNRVAYHAFAGGKRNQARSYQQSVFFTDKYDAAMKTAVEYVVTRGYTNWAYGLSGALTHIRNRNDAEKDRLTYVVFITDGEPNQSNGNQNGKVENGYWWELTPQTEVNTTPESGDLTHLNSRLPAAVAKETDGFYAIKYNVDGTAAQSYFDLLEANGAEVLDCETATEIDEVLAGIRGKIGKVYPSGTLTDTIGKDFTLIENDARYPISAGYAKTEENKQVTLTWNFENVSEKESVSFYVQLNEGLRTTSGTYLTNADFVADAATITGANLTYNALSIDANNELVEEAASVAMRSPEVTVSKVYSVTYQYDETAPVNAPAVPVDDTLYAAGETVDVADAPEMDHYVFTGWDTSVLTDGTKMPANDVVLVGSWVSAADYIMEYYVKVGNGEYTRFDNGNLPEGAPIGETVAANTVIDKTYLDGKGLPATISDGSYTYSYDRLEGITVAVDAENIVKIFYSYTVPVNPPAPPVTPPVTPPVVTPPVVEEEISGEDVPTTDAPFEEKVPEDAPFVEEEIFEEDAPLADVPETGDMSALWAATSVVSAAGVLFLGKKNKDEE